MQPTDHRPSLRRIDRAVARASAVLLLGAGLAACGGSHGDFADSTCAHYLTLDDSTRHSEAIALSSTYHVADAGNPMWGINMDYVCGQNPAMTLKSYFSRAGAAAATTTAAAAPTTSAATFAAAPSVPPSVTPEPSASAVPSAQPSASIGPSASAEPSVEPSASAAPTYAPVPVDLKAAVLTTVFTAQQESLACSSAAFGEVQNVEIEPKARLMLRCDSGWVVVDIATGTILWDHPKEDNESSLIYDGPHVFFVTTTDHPAVGLTAGYVTRGIVALNADTGQVAWAQPLEESVPKANRSNFELRSITETAGGGGAHPDEAVVQGILWSAFDAATGKPLWHIDQDALMGEYVGYDLAVVRGDVNGNHTWAATNLTTHKVVWSKQEPEVNSDGLSSDGTTATELSSRGILQINVRTGATLLNRVFPSTWSGPLIKPPYAVNYDGKKLSLFLVSNPSKPLWSVPSDQVTPLMVTPSFVLVNAPSGHVLLNAHNGQILSGVTLPDNLSTDSYQTNGLTELQDSSVFELAVPTG